MTQLVFSKALPALAEQPSVLIYDQKLSANTRFRAWAAQFPIRYGLKAGEGLKDFQQLAPFLARLTRDLDRARVVRPAAFVAVGGGSVTDFTGFLASIYKRGVPLIHVPSTWLAALDSAHGGKTALNVAGAKNQIGTFHPAEKVYLVQSLLASQPAARAQEARGELAKIALIDGGGWTRKPLHLWKSLPEAIRAKYRVVERDPYERKGVRRILNLGHTLGHVLEAHHGLAHGEAVAQGMIFALKWSVERKVLGPHDAAEILKWLSLKFGIRERAGEWSRIPRTKFLRLLRQDKKGDTSGRIHFVFLAGRGRAIVKGVTPNELLSEAVRQGWAK